LILNKEEFSITLACDSMHLELPHNKLLLGVIWRSHYHPLYNEHVWNQEIKQ